jgi:signal transduction histidine kinase
MLNPVSFQLRGAVGDTANAIAWKAQQKGLALIVEVHPAVPDVVIGDPGRLRQILVNLLGNAIKFTHRGEVRVRVSSERSTTSERMLLFSISDTGVGVPQNDQERIFEAFTQGDASVTRQYGGTGLGLTIAARFVELMGGRLWVESEEGRGSTFHFTGKFATVDGFAG